MSEMPEALQLDSAFVDAFIEALPRQINAYGWLCLRGKVHPRILQKVKELAPQHPELQKWLPKEELDS
jgi:hypothetical protein